MVPLCSLFLGVDKKLFLLELCFRKTKWKRNGEKRGRKGREGKGEEEMEVLVEKSEKADCDW